MLPRKTTLASTVASGRLRKAISPASSSTIPAAMPKTIGIHSFGLIVPLMLWAK